MMGKFYMHYKSAKSVSDAGLYYTGKHFQHRNRFITDKKEFLKILD